MPLIDIANRLTGLISDVATLVLNLLPAQTETTGTFSYDETDNAEQTVFTLTITTRSIIRGIWLDFVNVTRDTSIRVFHQIDGTNYREFQQSDWITADDDGILIEQFTAYRNVRLTFQGDGGGGGSVNISYAVV